MFEGSKLAKKFRTKKCESPGGKMARFVEPCLLIFLSEKPSHGYELMEKLDRFGFPKTKPDPALIYRTLHRLEKEKCVSSKWDTRGIGPAKKNYELTPKGLSLLHSWAETIALRKQVLEKFLRCYKDLFKK